ncbi:MAG: tyrosine-type recombinase/integrase [Armatimonadota bacterium]
MRRRAGVLRALLSPEPDEALQRLRRPIRFPSRFAPYAQNFLALKRAMGCRYKYEETLLADFDQYLAQEVSDSEAVIKPDVVQRYLNSPSDLTSHAKRKAVVSMLRQYCTYLYRRGCLSALPDWTLVTARSPAKIPFALSPAQVRQLLQAVDSQCTSQQSPLRVLTLKTIFITLFGAGLRISEALHLTVQDVDWTHDLLTIRQTKFGKTRLVPLHASLARHLRAYAEHRDVIFGAAHPDAPFFQHTPGKGYSACTVTKTFASLRIYLGWNDKSTGRPPTPHSLRHGFAHARLLQWYQGGEDVQTKLTLLSTYMGHVSLTGTQVYLQGTQAVLEAAMERFAVFGDSLINLEQGDEYEDE